MATTTYRAIRDKYITVIEAITPSTLPEKYFRRGNRRVALTDRAEDQNSTAGLLRSFEIRKEQGETQLSHYSPTQREINEEIAIAVAYPTLPKLYGPNGYDSLEDVIEQDADLIINAVEDAANYLSGQNVCQVTSTATQPTDDYWLSVISATITYYKAR